MFTSRAMLGCIAIAALLSAAEPDVYHDPGGRFSFSYPASFGAPSKGTDDGFQDRAAAVRFEQFPARFGREAVVTRGFPLVDLQAAGGLYDEITLQIFPAPLRQRVLAALPRLTAASFCGAIAAAQHFDPDLPAFANLTPGQRQAIAGTDRMRNENISVRECRVEGDVVVFDKQRSAAPGAPEQHVFGAVRFLTGRYSTFQFIAGGEPPDSSVLSAMADVVRSFTEAK